MYTYKLVNQYYSTFYLSFNLTTFTYFLYGIFVTTFSVWRRKSLTNSNRQNKKDTVKCKYILFAMAKRLTYIYIFCLGAEFSAGWSAKKSKKMVSKSDQTRQKIRKLSRDIYDQYFEAAQVKLINLRIARV